MISFCLIVLAAVAQINAYGCNQQTVVVKTSTCNQNLPPLTVSNTCDKSVVGGSSSGALTRNIVVKGKYPVALSNCGPTPDKQIPVITSHVRAPVQEKPTVRLPANIPAPKVIGHSCTCYKTIIRPRVHQQIVSVPCVQRYIETTHKPVVENIHYEACPVNCQEDSNCRYQAVEVPACGTTLTSGSCGTCGAQAVQIPTCGVQSCGVQAIEVPQVSCGVQTVQVPSCGVQSCGVQAIEVPQVSCGVQAVQVPSCGVPSCGVQAIEVPQVSCGVQAVQVPSCGVQSCGVQAIEVPQVSCGVQAVQVPTCGVQSVQVPTCGVQATEVPQISCGVQTIQAPTCGFQTFQVPQVQTCGTPSCDIPSTQGCAQQTYSFGPSCPRY